MEIKFKKKLSSYRYIMMFDLASKNTGVCIGDIEKQIPLASACIKVKNDCELSSAELKNKIEEYIQLWSLRLGATKEQILIVKEAMPTQLRGGSSTVQTFIALARSHGVFDTLLYVNNYHVYDYIGIYPITGHNYFKKVMNLNKEDKVTKELVHEYVVKKYNFTESVSLDESDAIFMCETFFAVKGNNDIKERITEVKRHRKMLKASHAIKSCEEEIEYLRSLLLS